MELGSEFWSVPQCETAATLPDVNMQFVLSGRTALELVARDLIAERNIRSVCLPAYCCDSMLFPFQRAGLELRFYDVLPSADGVRRVLPENHGCDAVLLLDYFGFSQPETAELAKREHDRGTAVILDRVQSLYSNIGINKIDTMLRTPNCPFVLFVGTKKLVKRQAFEEYISKKLVI